MRRLFTRREFIEYTSKAFAALAFNPDATASAEGKQKTPTLGRIVNPETEKLEGEPFPIIGVNYYNPNYDYYYLTKIGTETIKVPMAQVVITDGYPWTNVVTRPNLGIRLDESWASHWVRGCGASRIRTRATETQIGVAGSSFELTMDAANKNGLVTLAVLDTNHPWADDELRALIGQLCLSHPKIEIEALNEWDDPNLVRWQNQNPVTAAHFMAVVIDAVAKTNWKKGINTPVLLGSTINAANITSLITALLAEKAPLNDYRIKLAAHLYPNPTNDPNLDGIKNGVWYVSNEFQKLVGRFPKVDITEVGLAAPFLEKWQLLRIIETCFQQPGIANVYLHELINHTEGHPLDVNFGLINQDGLVTPTYYGMASLARRGITTYTLPPSTPTAAPKVKTPQPPRGDNEK